MPPIVYQPELSGDSFTNILDGDYKNQNIPYNYPLGLDLKPGSKLHDALLNTVLLRAQASHRAMSSRYNSWRDIDRTLTAYINTDWKKDAQDNKIKVEPIVIPVSYGALETLLTYMVTVFFETPIFQYNGVGPEDIIGAKLLEKCIENDCRRNKVALALYVMFRDSFAYGIAPVSPQWHTEKIYHHRDSNLSRTVESETRLEGNKLVNIDPYQFLPDPDVPTNEVQRGEFCGWTQRTNLTSILGEEELNPDTIFNCKYLRYMKGAGKSVYYTGSKSQSGRDEQSGMIHGSYGTGASNIVDIINMYLTIIPKSWGLGEEDYPRKWLFRVASDKILISAQPLGLDHNKFPVAVNAPTFDGYSISPMGILETTYGLQGVVDWLVQSHIANVKKVINDSIVVDPFLININDVKNPESGKIIRKRRAAWGKGSVMEGIGQLKVADATQSHLTDIGMLSEMLKNTIGTSDIVQGIVQHRGPRISASESQGAMGSALSRLEKLARITSYQGMYDIAVMFAYHTQQLMSENTYVSNTGEWEQMLRQDYGPINSQRTIVKPRDINIAFDVIPKDGTLPKSDGIDSWTEIFKAIVNQPILMQQFDIVRIFKHMARMLGAKDIDKFSATVMSDEQVTQQAQAGNIAPVSEVING